MDEQSEDQEIKKKPPKDMGEYSVSKEEAGDAADFMDIKPQQANVTQESSSSPKKTTDKRSEDEKEGNSRQHKHQDRFDEHTHIEENVERFGHVSHQQTSSYRENTQFLSRLSTSKEEFVKEYKRLYHGKAKAEELYLLILTKLKKAISEGNITELKKLSNLLDYTKDAEDEITLRDYYARASNPIKNTNLVILTCKYNKVKVLEWLFGSDNRILSNLPIDTTETTILPDDRDEERHNAFYYAIRSSNIELLDILIRNWPGNYFAAHLGELDKVLSKAYEELKLKNVSLSDKMEIFVENKLIDLRFFSNTSRYDQSFRGNLNNSRERIKLILENIRVLKRDYLNTEVDERFLFVAKFIAQNIHILKQQLKSTYHRLPWEEIEFCLVSFISSYIKQRDINLFYRSVLNKSKILNHLENFAKKIEDEKYITEGVDIHKGTDVLKLKREKVIAEIINSYPQFEELYSDYQQIRDIQSLKKISDYIKLALSADCGKREDQLIITRVLQVIGEHLKNTLESPKLSNTTSELLLLSLPKYTRKMLTDVRNSLSHAYSLFKRTEIEENKDVNFFIGIQNDIKKVGDVITNIFYDKKIKMIRTLLKKVINCDNLDEIKAVVEVLATVELDQMISEHFKMIEHGKLENLIKELSDNLTEKTNYERGLFHKINNIINSNSQSENVTNYITGVALLKSLNNCLSKKMMDHNDIGEIKCRANQALKNMVLKLIPHNLTEIATLSMKISRSVGSRIQDDTLDKVNRLIWEIFFIVELATDDIEWIKKLRDELNTKKKYFIPAYKQEKIYDVTEEKYNNQLALKLSDLRNILNNTLLCGQITETFPFYKDDEKLQTIIQMLVLDIMSILQISKKSLENNLLFLDDNTPLLSGKSLRNHLAHDNALVNILLSDPSKAVVLNAKKLIEENIMESNKKIGKLVSDDPSRLREKYDQDLVTITNQKRMFAALQEGNLESLKDCVRKGADLNARDINSWTTLHFAAEGPSVEVIKFILDQNLSPNVKDINGQSPLHVAAMHGRRSIVDFFIKEAGLHVDNLDNSGKTPLHIAAQYGHKDTVDFLLKSNANTFIQDAAGLSPLYYVMRNNHVDVAKILLTKEANVDIDEAMGGFTPLHEATENGHLELVNFLLEHKADINARNDRDWTPLHAAAFNGHMEIVDTLILKGADVNAKVINGCTPLHYAAETGHEKIVSILLKQSNVNAVDKTCNRTALHCAAKDGHEEVVKILLQNKANASGNTVEGITPLHLAVQSGHLEMVTILLKHGVNIHAKDKTNVTPLHYAVKSGHKEVAEVLIRNGAEVNAKTNSNITPLHEATRKGYTDIAELLIKHKAEVNAQDIDGDTPLHAAAMNGSINVIDLLIKKKADVNARTKTDITPLHIAARHNHVDAIVFLIKNETNVNAKAKYDFTPLHAAVLEGHKTVVDLLIKNKAQVDVRNSMTGTPLLIAVEAGHKEIVEILITNGANINIKINNCTPLLSAIKFNKKEIVEVLIANGANVNTEPKPLFLAVRAGYKDIVDILLKTATHVNIKGPSNITPLHVAAEGGHKRIVNALITSGAHIDATCINGETPLYFAAYKGYKEVVEILIANGATVNVGVKSADGATPLYVAATLGHTDVVKILLNNKANINIKDYEGRTALELTVAHGRLEVVKALLQYKKVDMNTKGNDNYTILHIASQESNLEMVKYLVDKGSDINAKNASGSKPVHIAAREGHKDTIEFFLSKGLSVNEPSTINQTLLHYATINGHLAVLEYLIAQGADVNAQDINGISAMHIAAGFGYRKVIEVLLKNGASYNIVDKLYRKPLVMARDKNFINLLTSTKKLFQAIKRNDFSEVESCIKMGAVINAKSADGGTSLHYAAWKGNDRVVSVLLQHRANSNAVDNKVLTPLHYAAKFSHLKVVKALLSNGAIYNAVSDNDKTPLNLTVDKDILYLFKLVNESFKNIKNGNSKVINDLNKIKDVDTIKAIMGAHNRENKTLVVVAVHSNFSKLDQLKQISQGDVSSQLNTALALLNQSKYQKALSIYKSVFEKKKEILGPDNPGTLDIQTCIAKALYVQGCYQEALNTLEDIFQKRKEVLGLNNTDTLNTKSTIALVLHGQGKNEEAFNIYQEVYQKQKEILGPNHSDTLDTQFHMALVLDKQGKYEEALNINRIIFEKRRNMSDVNAAVGAVRAQNNIAMVLCNQGKYAEALEIYKEVFEKKKVIFGSTHSDTLKTSHNIAGVLFHQKKYHEALKTYQEVLNIRKSVLGPNHIDTLYTQGNIANVLFAQAKWIGALKAYKETFDQLKSVFGPNHPSFTDILQKIETINSIFKLEGRSESEVLQYLQKDINIAASNGD
ncbi:LOW QUALITY PROTEIN: uncharacterized protein LOC105285953 [Ooceraea biroi]|nr:LOW QUALITY PROTEIN: uncharacterized protein LOC105285953 [Ooceraea biroi]